MTGSILRGFRSDIPLSGSSNVLFLQVRVLHVFPGSSSGTFRIQGRNGPVRIFPAGTWDTSSTTEPRSYGTMLTGLFPDSGNMNFGSGIIFCFLCGLCAPTQAKDPEDWY